MKMGPSNGNNSLQCFECLSQKRILNPVRQFKLRLIIHLFQAFSMDNLLGSRVTLIATSSGGGDDRLTDSSCHVCTDLSDGRLLLLISIVIFFSA